ncbi:CC0125/CC1285 family lipoprotein [Undibacterium squillarum]|uniref:CC0125/CC1285 family lipoprotein n=1 Tax=Undibacterium squillarum TaxID=1131567 RepID=UPI0035B4E83C
MPILAISILSGCATGYHSSSNPTGGYWEKKGPGQLIKVGFSGNGYVTRQKVGAYLLYRCAEITQREGKKYFAFYVNLPAAVMDQRSSKKNVTKIGSHVTDYAYILFFDDPSPGLLDSSEVIASLEKEVKGNPEK